MNEINASTHWPICHIENPLKHLHNLRRKPGRGSKQKKKNEEEATSRSRSRRRKGNWVYGVLRIWIMYDGDGDHGRWVLDAGTCSDDRPICYMDRSEPEQEDLRSLSIERPEEISGEPPLHQRRPTPGSIQIPLHICTQCLE